MYTIIRIEDINTGNGMFNSDKGITDFDNTKNMYKLHAKLNPPFEDGINREEDDFCAFSSMEAFNNNTIPEELKWLLINHTQFQVLLLNVSTCKIGNSGYQVCYKKKDIITQQNITSLFI